MEEVDTCGEATASDSYYGVNTVVLTLQFSVLAYKELSLRGMLTP